MIRLIPRNQLEIGENRQRREFDPVKIGELASSIELNGLLQPIVVRPNPAGGWLLVAGERRLRALESLFLLGSSYRCGDQLVPPEVLAVLPLADLDTLAAEEAELHENLLRVNLTWQEEAAAVARLRELRTAAVGAPVTALELGAELLPDLAPGSAEQIVRQNLIAARSLSDPDVAKAKSLREANKIIRQKDEAKRNATIAAGLGRESSRGRMVLIQDDCLKWMTATEARFDVILSDPPYGMGAESFGDADGKVTAAHTYDDSQDAFVALMEEFIPLTFQVAKDQAHLYLCCDIDGFHILRGLAEWAGWWVHRTPIVIYKTDGNRVPWPHHGPQRKWELCLYAVKGKKPTLRVAPDVIETRGDENLGHGAQKPVALYTELLSRSARPGDSVLDPFAGTGTIFPAAHAAHLYATGVEREPTYAGIAARRIQELPE